MEVSYDFRGQVSNEEIHKFYRENKVDCFITTSSTEGLPVSIMEAMSYGIPIIATDVGGISEMIDGNGVLLSSNPNVIEVYNAINKIITCDSRTAEIMHENSIRIWENKFNAERNAAIFAEKLRNYSDDSGNVLIMTIDSVTADLCFMRHELAELSQRFHVILIETKPDPDKESIERTIVKSISSNIELLVFYERRTILDIIAYAIKYWFDSDISIEKKSIFNSRAKIFLRYWESIKYYASSERFYKWLNQKLNLNSKFMFYSFWMQNTTLAICKHSQHQIIVSRAHGYDLYDERYNKGFRQPFREYINSKLDGIFFVSQHGKEYYVSRYGEANAKKMIVSYIGSELPSCTDYTTDKKKEVDRFNIVSCSSLIPIKRVELIIEALKYLKRDAKNASINWIHFGDGEQRESLEQLVTD